jgi:hypothetical protein
MQVQLPKSDTHPLVKITAEYPGGSYTWFFDQSHRQFEMNLPEGTVASQVTIHAEWCRNDGEPDPKVEPVVLQEPSHEEDVTTSDATSDTEAPAESESVTADSPDAGGDEPHAIRKDSVDADLGERSQDDAGEGGEEEDEAVDTAADAERDEPDESVE